MTGDMPTQGLLPTGLSDLLDPEAGLDAAATQSVLSTFTQFGYRHVKPPLVEFEDSLLHEGPGAAVAQKAFRLMDPISHKMMALRSDMTAQIARISGTRLHHLPRPLRLAYAGEVMRVVPDVLNPERQLVQAGAELIGRADNAASAEIIVLGARALQQVGISGLTLDLGAPRLVQSLLAGADQAMSDKIMSAVRERDSRGLEALSHPVAGHLAALLRASGSDPAMLAALVDSLPEEAGAILTDLLDVAVSVQTVYPDLPITLDPLELHGIDYHTGIGFAFFGAGLRGEIARGGSYITGFDEEATGISIYMERVLRGLPAGDAQPRIYLPADLGLTAAMAYADRGRHLVIGAAGTDDMPACEAEARALGCGFIVRDVASGPEALE